ncbi:MAG: hypothetical protein AB1430_10925 [Pseudomonadota bacterium]
MRPTPRSRALPVALACAALLAACGGGGGDGNDDGPRASAGSDINATNYQSFSGPLAHAVLDLGGGTAVAEPFGPGPTAALSGRSGLALLSAGPRRAIIQSARRQTVYESNTPCDHAGSLSTSVDDANDNNILDAGDSIAFTAASCQFAANEPPMNGGFSMTLLQVQFDGQNNPRSMQVSGSFSNLGIGSDAMNGRFQLSLGFGTDGSQTLQMSFVDLSATHGGTSLTYNATLSASYSANGSGSFSLQGTLKAGGETYLLEQTTGFGTVPTTLYPVSGSVRLKDAAGDTLVLEARSGDLVDFKFYPAGAAQPAATLPGRPWSDYGG